MHAFYMYSLLMMKTATNQLIGYGLNARALELTATTTTATIPATTCSSLRCPNAPEPHYNCCLSCLDRDNAPCAICYDRKAHRTSSVCRPCAEAIATEAR